MSFALRGAALLGAAVLITPLTAAHADVPVRGTSADDATISLDPVGTFETGVFDAGAAEIVAFHPATRRTFTVNAEAGTIDVLDSRDPSQPSRIGTITAEGTPAPGGPIPAGASINSVAVRSDGLVVAAVEAPTKTDPGWLLLGSARSLRASKAVRVGAQPDMVALSPDGRSAVLANEGEPNDDFTVDPVGSVSVVTLPPRLLPSARPIVRTAGFTAWDPAGSRTLPAGVRVFGPEVTPARRVSSNLEPEYVTIDARSRTAWVTLQEANAIAEVDLRTAAVTAIRPLGTKDHSVTGQGLDPSDRDSATDIRTAPVRGLFQPDGIASYVAGGSTYLVTANEGDVREWGDYVESARLKDLGKAGRPALCPGSPAAALLGDAQLGRLNVSIASGSAAGGTCIEQPHAFGARSFSVWTADGTLVFDSGEQLERIVADALPEAFNTNHTSTATDGRSDDKGPEPEGVVLGRVGGRTYAFIGLERVGGVAAFDVTDPRDVTFETYVNRRDTAVSAEDLIDDGTDPAEAVRAAGDLGPEGLAFVPAGTSPTGKPLVVVGNEVSGTTTFFEVGAAADDR